MTILTYPAIRARQSETHTVLSFAARASELMQFATIDRVARDATGQLRGFQRPQIAGHIREIRDYLEKADAILPNPIVVAFTSGITVNGPLKEGPCTVEIDIDHGPLGLVVDGQQRLTALSQVEGKDFQVLVSAVVCADDEELRRQFVLINNTRPLPKSLIYELLPTVEGLPRRLSDRSLAADLAARLNYDERSSLRGLIHQHTNPDGIIRDTAIQRVVINSASDGVMRELLRRRNGHDQCFDLISEFYRAVQTVFRDEWRGHAPKSSRLVHGAGIMAMGYVMEVLALLDGARTGEDFSKGLRCLVGKTAWTSGKWDFGGGDRRHWKAIQNVNRDIVTLAQYLIGIVRSDVKIRRSSRAGVIGLIETTG
ncbi:MAG: DGQHR domain-containing protein [Mesorhizobium sp.]|uniref:DGQHR domain-containing protein DpdB n=2 Tax=Mesorhizobium TaxID=68287 RepID=UPI000FC99AD6|nr:MULTISPECIES: DGQHR domain-containing protein DpdB [unclassified Mesorhizobium]RUV59236.1 DGQHR domain-containing protein [Mesorhizobium sp. M5C.F.Ca.IN.020.29.1.1]RWC21151.1 MAG: DGQHR domain-containing protein [Mesorhizobium sp.]RWD83244.1 MAG: DGQHR domain-containing protein [Mesorhizobium sp.]RWE58419.1 MAG: DGQHR domain-containing protein [Mesorhizobium sp.]RWF54282.1 MAG: DGQHR domain-containing protein [Mesorhizobium sp.]